MLLHCDAEQRQIENYFLGHFAGRDIAAGVERKKCNHIKIFSWRDICTSHGSSWLTFKITSLREWMKF